MTLVAYDSFCRYMPCLCTPFVENCYHCLCLWLSLVRNVIFFGNSHSIYVSHHDTDTVVVLCRSDTCLTFFYIFLVYLYLLIFSSSHPPQCLFRCRSRSGPHSLLNLFPISLILHVALVVCLLLLFVFSICFR